VRSITRTKTPLRFEIRELQHVLFRAHAAVNEQTIALAALETVEAQLNRAETRKMIPAPRP
jgi:hypothetical protein